MTAAAPRVAVLGGGIAGLSAAWECHRQGLTSVVLERDTRPGGVVRTEVVDHAAGRFVLDTGPDAFLATKAGALELCRELGIEDQLIPMQTPAGAYVLRGDTLHELPHGGAFGVATRLRPFLQSTLLSTRGKVRTAFEIWAPARRSADDESAGEFFRRRFGDEFARRVAQPLLGGIHAGDLDRLSAQAVVPQLVATERAGRSVLLGLRAQSRQAAEGGAFRSFPGGMATLVDQLQRRLPDGTVRLGSVAESVERTADGWCIRTASGITVDADILVLAAPAATVAQWLRGLDPRAAELAAGVRYVSSAAVLAAYRTPDVARPLRGSGYVSARDGRERLLATSWLTGKWAGRAPTGYTVLRGFYGGAFDQAVLEEPDQTLADDAQVAWARRFGITGGPVLTRVVRWPGGSPQHEVGHGARVLEIDERLRRLGALSVAGSGFRAVGIPDVISDARRTMRSLLDGWRAR